MRLIAVGRAGEGPEAALFARYAGRLRPALRLVEIAEGAGAPAEALRREGEAILAALPARAQMVALDLGGTAPDSAGLAALLDRWRAGGEACFVIGGAEGLPEGVLGRAHHVLSLGPLTWPHMLARAMLAEQLFRAQCIQGGHPYHRARRPGDGKAAPASPRSPIVP